MLGTKVAAGFFQVGQKFLKIGHGKGITEGSKGWRR
jgi:hypothetical protein